ncbi:VOC family protein [Streptomyces sp. NPDC048603]|uniref:VOC family protein n=1 Tax=Streptomyces sp. NPDC048603 TaxID=3365577 RepID=UPI003714BAF9
MVLMTSDVLGAPCWLSLTARDRDTAERFYREVLGWTFRRDTFGRAFSVAEHNGVPVAGIGAVAGELAVPVVWTPYFAVDDADQAVARVRERGGTVGVGPVSYQPRGRAALATDLEGAVFGLWEGTIEERWRVGEDAPAWLELHTRDAFEAAFFYGEVLEWATVDDPTGCCEVSYEEDQVVLRRSGTPVARLNSGPVEAASPKPQRRPRWLVHFKVPDLVAATAAVNAHGGTVVEEEGPARVTVSDPDGGLFTLDEVES